MDELSGTWSPRTATGFGTVEQPTKFGVLQSIANSTSGLKSFLSAITDALYRGASKGSMLMQSGAENAKSYIDPLLSNLTDTAMDVAQLASLPAALGSKDAGKVRNAALNLTDKGIGYEQYDSPALDKRIAEIGRTPEELRHTTVSETYKRDADRQTKPKKKKKKRKNTAPKPFRTRK